MSPRPRSRPAGRLLLLAALVAAAALPAAAEVVATKDGRTLDGKVVKEDAQFLWIKTLARIEKVALTEVVTRIPGESQTEKYEKILLEAQKEPPAAAALWDLYVFQKNHANDWNDEDKRRIANEQKRLVARVIKLDPDHEAAHRELGEVKFEGQWIKEADLARIQAERATQKLKAEWTARLGVPVEVCEGEHCLLVDNTGEKDLVGRAKNVDRAYDTLVEKLGVEPLFKGRQTILTIKAYDDYVRILDDFAAQWNVAKDILASARDRGTGGLWRHRPEPAQIRWPSSGYEGMWSAIVHNTGHVAMWTIWGKNIPATWLDEGMSAWVETDTLGQQMASCIGSGARDLQEKPRGGTTDKQPKKKKPSAKKNADSLKEAVNEYKERCIEAVNNDDFPSMREFLKFRIGNYGPPEEGGAIGLVTWLMGLDLEKFHKLVAGQRAQNRRTEDDYWRESYEFQTLDEMETKWKQWVVSEW